MVAGGGNLGKATFALEADTARFQSDMKRAKGIANKATRNIGNKFKSMGQNMMQAGQGLTMAVTAPILGVMAISGKAFLDYDKSLNRIRFLTKATAEDLPAIEAAVLDISKAVGIMPTEAAGAFYFALSSGAKDSAQAVMVLTQTLRASAMGLGDAETITRVVLGLINAYGLDMETATVVTGQFISMIESGLAEPEELANSLGRIVGVAKNMAVEIPQIMAAISTMTVKGMASGPKAVTMVSGFFRSMVRMSKRQQDMWEHPTLSLNQLIELIGEDLGLAMKTINEAFDSNFPKIKRFVGSAEAANAIMAMGSKEGFAVYAESLDEMGTAGERSLEKWEKYTKTFEYQLNQLKVEWQTTLIAIGQSFMPLLMPLVKVFKLIFKVIVIGVALFGKLPMPIKYAMMAFVLLIAAIGPLLMMFGLLFGSIGGVILGLNAMGGVSMFATAKLWLMGFSATGAAGKLRLLGIASLKASAKMIPLILSVLGFVAVLAVLGFAILAFIVYFDEIQDAIGSVMESFDDLAKGAYKLGYDMIIGVTKGIIAATGVLYAVVSDIVQELVNALNPFRWVFGSYIVGTYDKAGAEAGRALTTALHEEARNAGEQTTEDITPDSDEIADDFEEIGESAGEAMTEGIVRAIADANMVAAIGRAIDAAGIIAETFRLPLQAMRGMVSDLTSELNRLARLPSIESAAEDLEKAELALEQMEFKQQIRQGEKRIKQVDKEIRKLVDQRNMIVFLAKGRTTESDAIDDQIRALSDEKKELEKSVEASEEKSEAIQEEIDVLDRLGETRDLERDILVARGEAADATLASDAEIIAQLGKMEGVVGDVTSELREQTSTLQTEFIPAWAGVVDMLNEAGAAGAGAGAGAGGAGAGVEEMEFPELGELEALGEIDWEDPLKDLGKNIKSKLKKFVKKYAPVFAAAGIAMLIAFFLPFSIPLIVAAAIGALVGLLIMKFQKPIIKFFKKMGEKVFGFLKKHWKKIVLLISGPFLPLVALATDAFGIRSALIGAFKSILKFVKKWATKALDFLKKNWPEIATIISGPFAPLVMLATDAFGVRSALIDAFEEIKDFVIDVFSEIEDFVTEVVGDVADAITGAFKDTIKWIESNWAAVIAEIILAPFFFIRAGAEDLWGIRTAMKNAFSAIINFVTSSMATIKTTMWNVFNEIVSLVIDAFNEIKDFIINTLTALPGQVFGLALSIGTTIFNAVLSGMGFLSEIHTRIIDALNTALNAVLSIATSIGSSIFTGIMDGLGEIGIELWNRIPKPLQWVFEKLAAGVKIAIDVDLPDIPGAGMVESAFKKVSPFHQEGLWNVPGPTRDHYRAMLGGGEMIMPRDAAQVLRDFFTGGGEQRGRGDVNVTVHNPQPEAAEDTVRRRLQALAQLGAT